MKRRGFTLLELMIVIIIIGVLATVGIMQYRSSIERAKSAEARQILGSLRAACAAIYMDKGNATTCDNTNLAIGTGNDEIPSACRSSNDFSYASTGAAGSVTLTATRCTSGGKTDGPAADTLILTTTFPAGTDAWSGTLK